MKIHTSATEKTPEMIMYVLFAAFEEKLPANSPISIHDRTSAVISTAGSIYE